MLFDIFRKSDNTEGSGYLTDDLGEWMLISHNKELLLATNLISKAIRKAGVKDFNLYLGYFSTDERIKSLISIKGMAVTKENKKNIDVRTSMRNVAGEDAIVIEDQPHSVCNICNSTFIFFNFLLLIKKGKEYKRPVKLLLPPMGINPSEIPLSLSSLLKTLLERNLNAICSLNEIDAGDGSRLKLMATCRTESSFDTEKIKNAMSYFAPEKPKLFTKRIGTREMEISLYIQQLNVKFFIPLLWNNFLEQLRC